MDKKLENACKFIQRMDRNSDIMDCFEEYKAGEMSEEVIKEICYNVLDNWLTDSLTIPDRLVDKTDLQHRTLFREYMAELTEDDEL